MKQNSQWLSHVRTRSNTALDTSAPSGSPAALLDLDGQLEAAAVDLELELGVVGQQPPLDHVARYLAVDRTHLVAGDARRSRSAGDPGATATTTG